MKIKISSFHSGFSLLELIIAMAVIAIVTSAIWGNFFSSLAKGRDSRRKQDLQSISKALDIYYQDFRAYPTLTLPNWGTVFAHPDKPSVIYMQRLPSDPSYPNSQYCYTSDASGSYYKLYADLENTQDPNAFATEVLCDTIYYNYGISSTNTTP